MEKNLGEFAQTFTQGIWIGTGIFAALFFLRLYLVIKNRGSRKWITAAKGEWLVIALKFLFFLGLLAFLADIPVWFITVATFRPIASLMAQHAFIFVLVSIAVMEIILSFTVSESLLQQFIKRILFLLVSVFCSFAFILAAIIVPGTFVYPPIEKSVLLDLPVKGTWLAMHAGENKWVNYHSNYPPQAFGMDMVKLNEEGMFFTNNGADTSDHYAFGDSVFAPTAGIVFAMVDGLPNKIVHKGEDTISPAGNYIGIDLQNGKYLFLAHLMKGSISVQTGDTLSVGSYIGLCGNSGNTTFPHLHMHIQDKPTMNDTTALGQPFRFRSLERKRFVSFEHLENAYLNRNDQFKNK
jgi:hypothetical protein